MFDINDQLKDTSTQAVAAFMNKDSQEGSKKIIDNLSSVKDMLEKYRKHIIEVKSEYEKTAITIGSIGNELKKFDDGAIAAEQRKAGKVVQTVPEEMQGITLTRFANIPVKNGIRKFENAIREVDNVCDELRDIATCLQA